MTPHFPNPVSFYQIPSDENGGIYFCFFPTWQGPTWTGDGPNLLQGRAQSGPGIGLGLDQGRDSACTIDGALSEEGVADALSRKRLCFLSERG